MTHVNSAWATVIDRRCAVNIVDASKKIARGEEGRLTRQS
jgi:hypothetical protein